MADAAAQSATQPGRSRLRRACDAALDLLYPRFCMACGCCLSGTDSGYVCPACWEAIPRITEPSCGKCGSFLGKFAQEMDACEDCRRHDLRFKRAVCAAKYDEPLRSLILKLKFGSEMLLAEPLSRLLIARLTGHDIMGRVGVVVPVPLHRKREKTRGFNQAELIAERISRRFSIPMDTRALQRIRETPPQAGLPESERLKNLEGAFYVRYDGGIRGKAVLLVDDVLTTGATASECAVTLKKAGAKSVFVATVAR